MYRLPDKTHEGGWPTDPAAEAAMQRWADSGPRLDLEPEVVAPLDVGSSFDADPYDLKSDRDHHDGIAREVAEGALA